jgi:ATP-dependent Lon protease
MFPFDLSKVDVYYNANRIDTVPSALRDRMEVINMPLYERKKLQIAKKYLVRKQLKKMV